MTVPSDTATGATPDRQIQITLIGDPACPDVRAVRSLIQNQRRPANVNEFETVQTTLNDLSGRALEADVIVVFQSWSEQYCRADVDALIGRTLNSHLLCCCGPWCESDGRNNDIWPDAVRIPARLIGSAVAAEINACRNGKPAPPVTAARDEVFARRSLSDSRGADVSRLRGSNDVFQNAIVVSFDQSFAATLQRALEDCGLQTAVDSPLSAGDTSTTRASISGTVHLVLYDLDPWSAAQQTALQNTLCRFPDCACLGIAAMPETLLLPDSLNDRLAMVLPKLDLVNGLQVSISALTETRNHTNPEFGSR